MTETKRVQADLRQLRHYMTASQFSDVKAEAKFYGVSKVRVTVDGDVIVTRQNGETRTIPRPRHMAPTLWILTNVVIACGLLSLIGSGVFQINYTPSHLVTAGLIIGAWLGINAGWGRHKPKRHDVLDSITRTMEILGFEGLMMHEHRHHHDD